MFNGLSLTWFLIESNWQPRLTIIITLLGRNVCSLKIKRGNTKESTQSDITFSSCFPTSNPLAHTQLSSRTSMVPPHPHLLWSHRSSPSSLPAFLLCPMLQLQKSLSVNQKSTLFRYISRLTVNPHPFFYPPDSIPPVSCPAL